MPKLMIFTLVFLLASIISGAAIYTHKNNLKTYMGNSLSEGNFWMTPDNSNVEAIEKVIEYNYVVVKDKSLERDQTASIKLKISSGTNEEILSIPSNFNLNSIVENIGDRKVILSTMEFLLVSFDKPLLVDMEIVEEELKLEKIIPAVKKFNFSKMSLADRPTI